MDIQKKDVTPPVKPQFVYTLEFNEQEAEVVRELFGSVVGEGPVRHFTNLVFDRLGELGVKNIYPYFFDHDHSLNTNKNARLS